MDHAVLAKELYLYMVRNTESKWFQSYLSDSQQVCKGLATLDNIVREHVNHNVGGMFVDFSCCR